jgi:hypothetical protein
MHMKNQVIKKMELHCQVEAYSNYYLQLIDKLILITPLIFFLNQVQEELKFPDKANALEDTLYLPFQPQTFLHERNLSEQQYCYKEVVSIAGPTNSELVFKHEQLI